MSHFFYWQLGCLSLLVVLALFHRFSWLNFKLFAVGFILLLLVWMILVVITLILFAIAVVKLDVLTAFLNHGLGAVLAIVILVLLAIVFLQVKKVPPIHNISTDIESPPEFEKAQSMRGPGDNSLEYTDKIMSLQKQAYPQLNSLLLDAEPDQVFDTVLTLALQEGWKIHYKNKAKGVIEATDTSKLFGFVDDVAIRIRASEVGSKVDLRSVSRVGVSDLGANAKRIQHFFRRLENRFSEN